MKYCRRYYAPLDDVLSFRDVFLISGLFWVWFLKWKQGTRVNYNKDSIIQVCNFIKKRLQHRCFPVINGSLIIFQRPRVFGSMFFRVHDFQGQGLSGSGHRIQVQVLEVALCIYMEITLRHVCCLFQNIFL